MGESMRAEDLVSLRIVSPIDLDYRYAMCQ